MKKSKLTISFWIFVFSFMYLVSVYPTNKTHVNKINQNFLFRNENMLLTLLSGKFSITMNNPIELLSVQCTSCQKQPNVLLLHAKNGGGVSARGPSIAKFMGAGKENSQPKSLQRSRAVGDFYGTGIEIWAGFGPVWQLLRPVFFMFS